MSDTALLRLLDVPDRYVNTSYLSEDTMLAHEFIYEKLLSVLSRRFLGLKKDEVSFDKSALMLHLNGRAIDFDDVLPTFVERYVGDQNSLYFDILNHLDSLGQVYILNPRSMVSQIEEHIFDKEISNVDSIMHLFKSNKYNITKEDADGFITTHPNIALWTNEILSDVAEWGKYEEVEGYECMIVFKSEKIGKLSLSDKQIKESNDPLSRSLKILFDEFGPKDKQTKNGIYWGYDAFGDDGYATYNSECPMILQPSFIAAVKVLKDTLK